MVTCDAYLDLLGEQYTVYTLSSMDKVQDGWFSEECHLWPGQKFSLEVEKVLHHEKSKFQDILIFQR